MFTEFRGINHGEVNFISSIDTLYYGMDEKPTERVEKRTLLINHYENMYENILNLFYNTACLSITSNVMLA